MEFYATVCRLCECPDQTGNNWVELFSDKNEYLLVKIRAFVNVAICDNDGLPKRICGRCHQDVERAYNFKIQCEITDAKLRHQIEYFMKHGVNHELPVPPFDCNRFLMAQDGTKQDVILAAEKVYVKTEPNEDEDSCSTTVEAPLNVGLDWSSSENRDKPSASEESDSEDDFCAVEKTKSPEAPKQKLIDKNIDIVCDICGDHFDVRQRLLDHKTSKHPNHKYQCKECSKTFSKKVYLDDHEARHKGVRPYECPHCGKKYFTSSGLRSHVQDHGNNLPFDCDKCARGFSTASKLRIHYAIHIETRDFICDVCNKGFKTLANLNQHKTSHLPREQQKKKAPRKKKDYVCQYCGKVSTHYEVHNTHVRTHTGDQPFECHICLRRFASWGSHKKHLLVHTGEKPHVCKYCQKPFRQKHHMDSHIRGVHTKETPYKCKFCPRAFATLGNMREHEKSHGEFDRKHERVNLKAASSQEYLYVMVESAEQQT